MKETFLGLGSNIGDRESNILQALFLLSKKLKILDFSSIYNSVPVGYQNQDDFLNMVVKSDTACFTPFELLAFIKDIEKEMGRIETFRWGPRLIDIDILFIKDIYIQSDRLVIPHPELWKRNFVLIPLSELTEYIIIKKNKFVIKEMINRKQTEQVILYKSRKEIMLGVQKQGHI